MTRRAVRAIVLASDERILLMSLEDPISRRRVWITPGGAVEAGETETVGLSRELAEETGLQDAHVGPRLWTRSHRFEWNGRVIDQDETFYLVETEPFEATMANNPAASERSAFRGFRWWSVADLQQTSEAIGPPGLAALVANLIHAGPPAAPFDISIETA